MEIECTYDITIRKMIQIKFCNFTINFSEIIAFLTGMGIDASTDSRELNPDGESLIVEYTVLLTEGEAVKFCNWRGIELPHLD